MREVALQSVDGDCESLQADSITRFCGGVHRSDSEACIENMGSLTCAHFYPFYHLSRWGKATHTTHPK